MPKFMPIEHQKALVSDKMSTDESWRRTINMK